MCPGMLRKLFMAGKKNPCNCGNVTVVFLIASTKVDEAVEGAVDSWLQPSLI